MWLALLAIPCIASMCIATLFSVWFLATAFWQWFLEFFMSESEASALLMNTPVLIASVVIYTALIFWYLVAKKRGELSRSGEHVAQEIGASVIRRRSENLPARQLHNITEEMAVAAGVPAPALYLWPTPAVINAFAIGHTTADAAIFVSQGAIDALTRDEMQALIGHRMSQVLNGDMALNSRLASYLYAFRFAPRVAKWWLFFPTHDEEILERIKATLVWLFFALWIGLALSIVTFPQYVGARLLQAAISRERQRLADASALQFTRNPEALKGVLIKALALGTISPGTPMLLDDLAQTCFAAPVKRRYLDTHLPLEQRLLVLDPALTRARIAVARREAFEEIARRKEITAAELERQQAAAAQRKQAAAVREKFVRQAAAVAAVASARKQPAEPSRSPIAAADDARAALIGLLLDRQPEVQSKQFAVVARRFGESSMPAVKAASESLAPLVPAQRTIAMDKLLPAIREIPAPELRHVAALIPELSGADAATDVFEYALSRQASVFIADVLEPRDPHGKTNLGDHAAALRTVFSVVAQSGSRRDAAAAFEVGMKAVGLEGGPRFAPLLDWVGKVDQALTELESLRPIAKELMLEGLQTTVKFDGQIVPAERELLRVIAASLHCPMARV
ncbi:MAG: M48 family metalloprotease [Peristeroidobacter soli]